MGLIPEASRFMREIPQQFKVRAENGNKYIEGYFAVFNKPYERWDDEIETIAPGAFLETIANDDVRALTNHDDTLVLGRNTASTLTLREDSVGLWASILVNPNDQDAVNSYARVGRGDVDQASFGFDILDYETEVIDGIYHYTIKKVKLYEISICTFPAYKDTSISARNLQTLTERKAQRDKTAIECRKAELIKRLRGEQE